MTCITGNFIASLLYFSIQGLVKDLILAVANTVEYSRHEKKIKSIQSYIVIRNRKTCLS